MLRVNWARLTLQVTLNLLHTVASASASVHGGRHSRWALRPGGSGLPWNTGRPRRTLLGGRADPRAELWI